MYISPDFPVMVLDFNFNSISPYILVPFCKKKVFFKFWPNIVSKFKPTSKVELELELDLDHSSTKSPCKYCISYKHTQFLKVLYRSYGKL